MTGHDPGLELVGRFVRLVPLDLGHVDDLVAAAAGDRSTFGFTWVPDGRDHTLRFVDELLRARDAGDAVPFAQWRPDGTAVGCTRYTTLRRSRRRAEPDGVEIGDTWLAPGAQRTGRPPSARQHVVRDHRRRLACRRRSPAGPTR